MTYLTIISQNYFISGILQFIGILFALGAIPALIKYLAIRLSFAFEGFSRKPKTSSFEKYEHYISISAHSKEMLKNVLKTKVTLLSFFIIGVLLLVIGSSNLLGVEKSTADTIATIGTFMAIGFFAIYGIRFYIAGGWHDAGKAFNSMYLKYSAPNYVTENEYESIDGGPWKKVRSHTEDKNAPVNALTWVLNLFVTFIKLSMSITYIALLIIDDVYLIIKHVFCYPLLKKYYLRKAELEYSNAIEQVANNPTVNAICENYFVDDSLNAVAHKVHEKLLKSSLEAVNSEAEDFILFASNLEAGDWFTVSRTHKKLTTGVFGDKKIHVYEGAEYRTYACVSKNPNLRNPTDFFAHSIPHNPTKEYLRSLVTLPTIANFIRLYQAIYLKYAKENLSPDTLVNLYKLDTENSVVAVIKAKLKDIVVKDIDKLSESFDESSTTDDSFYTIASFDVPQEVGTKKAPIKEDLRSKPSQIPCEIGAFSVVLLETVDKRLEIISTIRKFSPLGITAIKNLVENPPSPVLVAVPENVASALVESLTALGAKAEIQNTPSDVIEQAKTEREKKEEIIPAKCDHSTDKIAKQEPVSSKVNNSTNKNPRQAKAGNRKRPSKTKRTRFALGLSLAILSLICLAIVCACFCTGMSGSPLPDPVYFCIPPLLVVWSIVFAIAEAYSFNKSHSKGKRVAGGILLLITALITTTLISLLTFVAKFINMTDDEINNFFSPISSIIGNLTPDPQSLTIIFPVSAGVTLAILLITIFSSIAVDAKLRKPKKHSSHKV